MEEINKKGLMQQILEHEKSLDRTPIEIKSIDDIQKLCETIPRLVQNPYIFIKKQPKNKATIK